MKTKTIVTDLKAVCISLWLLKELNILLSKELGNNQNFIRKPALLTGFESNLKTLSNKFMPC